MGFAEVKEWIDKVIDNRNDAKSLEQFSSQVELNFVLFNCEEIIVHKGVDIIAATIGEGLFTENIKDSRFDFKAYFNYRGYRFVQYCKNGELDFCV